MPFNTINMLKTNAEDKLADDLFIMNRLTCDTNVKILIFSIK